MAMNKVRRRTDIELFPTLVAAIEHASKLARRYHPEVSDERYDFTVLRFTVPAGSDKGDRGYRVSFSLFGVEHGDWYDIVYSEYDKRFILDTRGNKL